MTTQPQHPNEQYRTEQNPNDQYRTEQYRTDQRPDATADPLSAPTQPTHPADPEAYGSAAMTEPHAQTHSTHHQTAHQTAEGSADQSLFPSADLSGLRSRWDDVQAGFVDDPRQCVQTADGLVSDVVEQLTTGFSEARARLEQQWDRGEDVSTEDLRLALKRYREFFDRLLAV